MEFCRLRANGTARPRIKLAAGLGYLQSATTEKAKAEGPKTPKGADRRRRRTRTNKSQCSQRVKTALATTVPRWPNPGQRRA